MPTEHKQKWAGRDLNFTGKWVQQPTANYNGLEISRSLFGTALFTSVNYNIFIAVFICLLVFPFVIAINQILG